jgi:chromate transporter
MNAPQVILTLSDWWELFCHFLGLSLIAVGGAITMAPDIHRFMVLDHAWLNDTQFNSAIAIAQAAPGPNVLFVGLMGWTLGLNSGGGISQGMIPILLGLMGLCLSLVGFLLPSSLLTWLATRWARRNQNLRAVRAFKLCLIPLVMGLLLATAWTLACGSRQSDLAPLFWGLTALSTLVVWRTRIHMLWLLSAGAVIGAVLSQWA